MAQTQSIGNRTELIERSLRRLPFYDELDARERALLLGTSYLKDYARGEVLHDHRSECLGMVVLLEGRLRTVMQSPEGREVTIYQLDPGDVDVLSASCVINQITFDTMLVAEEDSRVLVVPAQTISEVHEENVHVENYILELTAQRFSDAMWTMQNILFLKADQRVATGLLDEYARTGDARLHLTQQELARSISSAREVVTRVLKRFEREGIVRVSRGLIELLDVKALYRLIG